jgi:hypothetical protein
MLAGAGAARAQDKQTSPVTPLAGAATPLPAAPPPDDATVDEGVDDEAAGDEGETVEDERYEELKEEVRQLRGVVAGRKPTFTLSGYADVGFFAATAAASSRTSGRPRRASSPGTRASTPGCSWATSWRPRSTRAASPPTWATRLASTARI